VDILWSSSSRMRVMNHNWSARKQCLHPQSVAEISRHSDLSEDMIRPCGTSSGSRHKVLCIMVKRQHITVLDGEKNTAILS